MFLKNWNIDDFDNQKWSKLQLKPNKQKNSNVFFHITGPTHFQSFISLQIWHISKRSVVYTVIFSNAWPMINS